MVRGGKREGSGRPKGTGKYGAPTVRVRVPEHKLEALQAVLDGDDFSCTLFSSRVSAGVPFAVEDYQEGKLDLNRHLIRRPSSTFFMRVSGDSMIDAGIHPDDLLVVDRSLTAAHGDVVIAVLESELTVKRLSKIGNVVVLVPDNPAHTPIQVTEEMRFEVWGVVTSVIHSFR